MGPRPLLLVMAVFMTLPLYTRTSEDKAHELGETLYAEFPYYTRQALVAAHMLFDKGLITPKELEAKMKEVRKRLEQVERIQ